MIVNICCGFFIDEEVFVVLLCVGYFGVVVFDVFVGEFFVDDLFLCDFE